MHTCLCFPSHHHPGHRQRSPFHLQHSLLHLKEKKTISLSHTHTPKPAVVWRIETHHHQQSSHLLACLGQALSTVLHLPPRTHSSTPPPGKHQHWLKVDNYSKISRLMENIISQQRPCWWSQRLLASCWRYYWYGESHCSEYEPGFSPHIWFSLLSLLSWADPELTFFPTFLFSPVWSETLPGRRYHLHHLWRLTHMTTKPLPTWQTNL